MYMYMYIVHVHAYTVNPKDLMYAIHSYCTCRVCKHFAILVIELSNPSNHKYTLKLKVHF